SGDGCALRRRYRERARTRRLRGPCGGRARRARSHAARLRRRCHRHLDRPPLSGRAAAVLPHAGAAAVRWLPLAAVLLAGAALADEAPPVIVHARVEPEHPTIGQRFRYVLDGSARPGTELVVAQPADRLGDFDIVDFGVDPPAEHDGRAVVTRWWRLVGWSPGEHVIESPAVRYRLPGEELRDAENDPTRVEVASVLGDAGEKADIRDIKGPEPIPRDLRPWYLAGGTLAALVALALAWRWLRGRARARGGGGGAPPAPRARRAPAAARARGGCRSAARAAGAPAAGAGRVEGVLLGAVGHRAALSRGSLPRACPGDDHGGVPRRDRPRRHSGGHASRAPR